MKYQAAIETYPGKVEEVILGSGVNSVRIGGEETLPFHSFEGMFPNPPKFALEICSTTEAADWTRDCNDLPSEPTDWATKYVEELGIELIALQLAGSDLSLDEMTKRAVKVVETVDVPIIIYGTGVSEQDKVLLPQIAEACAGKGLLLGPAKKENYREIAAACIAYDQRVIAQTPLDLNATKQLNIMLIKEGLAADSIVIDPLSSALGYGMEYSYSVMERIKLSAIAHNDKMMQMPIIANIGTECWKTKEAKEDGTQGIFWEGITALCFILAGANVVILRSPHTYKLIQQMLSKHLKNF
jgi:acetyl-CoA decarbonylase/synthase complex subunit delta